MKELLISLVIVLPVPGSFSTDSDISDVEKNISTEQYETLMSDVGIASSSNSDLSMNVSYNILQEPCSSVTMRGRTLIVNRRLAAAMDKCKVSNRDASHLLSACVESLSLNPMDYVINRSSIRRARQQYREDTAINIQTESEQLNVDFAVVHWDTKLLRSVTGIEKQDRLPVIVKTLLTEQLLGVPLIPSGSGKEISNAVFNTLEKWDLGDKVQAFVFDTTSSNIGRFNRACTLLEMKLGRNILFPACRHHIFELVLQAAMSSVKLYSSSGPDIPLFKKFKVSFPKINPQNISNCDTSSELVELIAENRKETFFFCLRILKNNQEPRHDYTEFLELVVILLGGTPPKGHKIRKPGAYHQARWMAKSIYSIKIFLLRSEFAITGIEEKALCRICGFIVVNYIKPWFTANKTTEAPWNDILLLKNLNKYKEKNATVAGVYLQNL
ncbi:hypothetical protein ILUMI_09936 [Ignelater luminosus]|uniref:Transposase n=1 Tax=Ignelater luminosus TaxID=2038154 RepID=A0A8K0D1D9_IGNLU|nr:hypothetical protein ILUMI_09936 [Ignelater luminosus]